MNKIILIIGLLLIATAASVSGYANINYIFNENNVQVEAYNCLDSACNTVGPFSGSFPQGKTTTTGKLTIRYPSTLASPHGYAIYYFANARLPMEGKATWHSYGDNNEYYANYNIDFIQANNCKSVIDEFTVVNELYANEPLVINVGAKLDATTHSAFYRTDNGIGYVPPAYKNEYYSVDTQVTLKTVDSKGNVVNTQTKVFSAANGNPLYMDTNKRVEFKWTPTKEGTYTSTVTTHVIDNQCSSVQDMSTSKDYHVYPARPQNQCYTLLKDLKADITYPTVGDMITFTYSKISNHADNNYVKTSIPTDVEYRIVDRTGNVVFTQSSTIPATSTDSFTQASFKWTPDVPGLYTASVYGIGQSNICTGLTNTGETIKVDVPVKDIPKYSLTFQIRDAHTGNPISGTLVNIGTQSKVSGTNGNLAFTDLSPATYHYTASHPSYSSKTGEVKVVNVDMTVMITLSKTGNTAPVIYSIPDIYMKECTTNSDLNLNNYVYDAESAKSDLTWTYSGNSKVAVNIAADKRVTFTAPCDWTGSERITFTVRDPQGATASRAMNVHVTSSNTAPTISGLPDITIYEDTQLFDAFHLPAYAYDRETASQFLQYRISSVVPDNSCGVSIGSNLNINVQPSQDWNGVCDVTVEVSDGQYTDTDSFRVTVLPVPDLPIITSSPITEGIVNVPYEYQVTAYDPDGDELAYSLAVAPQGMTINPQTGLIQWLPTAVGSYPVRLVVSEVDTTTMYSVEQSYILNIRENGNETDNQAPVAELYAVPQTIPVNSISTLTGIGNDNDGNIVHSVLMIGGHTLNEEHYNPELGYITETFEAYFHEIGIFTASFTVTDSEGLSDTAYVTINVTNNDAENQAPVAELYAIPSTIPVNSNVNLTGKGHDADGNIVHTSLMIGYHPLSEMHYSPAVGSLTETFEAYFHEEGIFTASFTVTDSEGLSDTAYVTINVTSAENGLAPDVNITAVPTSGYAPLQVQFYADISSENQIIQRIWDFGDGTYSSSESPSHTYTEIGTYTATLQVWDSNMLVGSDSVTITVVEKPITETQIQIIANPLSGYAPLNVSFDAIVTGDKEIVEYLWIFGDGTLSNELKTTHVYTKPGTYTATLRVRDIDGKTSSGAVIIRVNEPAGFDDNYFTTSSLHMNRLGTMGEEVYRPGDNLRITLSFENVRDLDLNFLKVAATVPEFGLYRSTGYMRLASGDKDVVALEMKLPYDIEPGIYDYRVIMTDNTVRKSVVRQFIIRP